MIDPHKIITRVPWLALDCEFSGMQKGETVADERIIEICMIKYACGQPIDSLATLLNVGDRPISRLISRMTGIWPNHLKDKPRFEHIASRAFGLFDDRPLIIAHNARRDVKVLYHEFARLGIELKAEYLCTYKLACDVFSYDRNKGYIGNYRLGTLCKHCDIPIKKAHRAQDDTEACAKLLAYMLRCVSGREGYNRNRIMKHDVSIGNLRKMGYISSV